MTTPLQQLVEDVQRAVDRAFVVPEAIWLDPQLFAQVLGEVGGVGWTVFAMPVYSPAVHRIVNVPVRPMGCEA